MPIQVVSNLLWGVLVSGLAVMVTVNIQRDWVTRLQILQAAVPAFTSVATLAILATLLIALVGASVPFPAGGAVEVSAASQLMP